MTAATLSAEGQPNETFSRLGFAFDQQAHDAAAQKTTAISDSAPLDPNILRLKKYVVTERPLPLEQDELLTPKGRVAVAEKRHLSPMYRKIVGPLSAIASLLHDPKHGWNPNAPEAMAIYEDIAASRRRNRIEELTDLAEFADQAKKAEEAVSRAKTGKTKR